MVIRDRDLVLRPWAEDDVPILVELCNDPEIARWIPAMPAPYTVEDALAFVHGEVLPQVDHLAITLAGAVVGAIGIGVSDANRRGVIGYWVGASTRGRGVCTRALRLLSGWAFHELDLRRLELVTDPDNVASQRVAEKAGFRREGMLRSYLLDRDGNLGDAVMFSLLPGELVE
jgi:RimJ/RimL family protein N-acetyltransferase